MEKIGKKGKANPYLMILLIGIVAFGVIYAFGQMQSISPTDDVNPQGCPESTGKLTVNSFSALSKATNVTPALSVGVNGGAVTSTATSGTTTFTVGDKLQIVSVLADYIDTELQATMTCGGLTLDNPMYYATSDNPALRIKNDEGDYVTDVVAGGAVNQTNVALGETINLDVEFTGTSLESSGDLIYVVEFPASTSGNITKVEMSGLGTVALPTVHTTQNAGSKVVAFEVPAVVGSEKKTYTLSISLGSAKDLAGGVYTDVYSKQKFVDTDGTVKYGVENADGTLKYENTLDFDFYINSA